MITRLIGEPGKGHFAGKIIPFMELFGLLVGNDFYNRMTQGIFAT